MLAAGQQNPTSAHLLAPDFDLILHEHKGTRRYLAGHGKDGEVPRHSEISSLIPATPQTKRRVETPSHLHETSSNEVSILCTDVDFEAQLQAAIRDARLVEEYAQDGALGLTSENVPSTPPPSSATPGTPLSPLTPLTPLSPDATMHSACSSPLTSLRPKIDRSVPSPCHAHACASPVDPRKSFHACPSSPSTSHPTPKLKAPLGSEAAVDRKAGKKRRKKNPERKREAKRRKRCQEKAEQDAFDYTPPFRVADKYVDLEAVSNTMSASEFERCEGAWIARKSRDAPARVMSLDELLAMGMRLVCWDGRCVLFFSPIFEAHELCSRRPKLIVDKFRRIIATLVGRPVNDPTWDTKTMEGLRAALEELRKQLDFGTNMVIPVPPGGSKENRRGEFCSATIGVSYGGGQPEPGNLKHEPNNQEAFKKFLENPFVQRVLKFGSDQLNLADGLCWIMANGDYDPTVGGHLILWELGLVVEFPPGATVLIPSAVITHGNVPVREGETRTSMTQYAAGGLFRWVEYGFQTERSLMESGSAHSVKVAGERATRWEQTVSLYSEYQSLGEDRRAVFGR
ncbi:hypothetical protein EIP86_008326 [Pleurotus ostreatoroseus]|nr:hypothetical protein EIP86_008326 [Pleurotus ostreatoroseus]